ncbi:MAG: CarD family transcriptional regulator [Phascolarctobacterium faecium]
MQKKTTAYQKQRCSAAVFLGNQGWNYVVHSVHGIGRYIGVENVLVDGVHRDYLLLAYAGDDKLYVPVEQVGMLHKYVGNEGQSQGFLKWASRLETCAE